MKIYWIYIECVILCVNVKYSVEQNGLPSSPCPSMFQYQHDGNEWYGSAQIPSSALGQTTKLQIMLSLRAELPSQYVGALELFGSREAAIQEIRSNQHVRYRVRFPLQSPLPKLTQIQVNGRILCSGQPETGPYITQIRLEHSLFTEIAAGQSPVYPVSGFDNNIYSQDPFVIYNNNNQDSNNNNPQQPFPRPTAPGRPQYVPIEPTRPQYVPIEPARPQYVPTNTQAPIYVQPPQPTINQPSYGSQSESEICGKPHERFQIAPLVVGGERVSRGAWPWLVAVYLNKATGLTFNCGGNLVSKKVVVTAAHCFRTADRTYSASDVLLILGRYNILSWGEEGSRTAEVEQLIIHSDYMSKDTSYDADVAIAIMRDRVQYSEYIRPICLWDGSDSPNELEGQMGTVVGWGRDGSGNIVTPEPKKINIPVVSEAVCLRSSDTYRYITSKRTFCAGGRDGTGPCNGDSGSGMTMVRNRRWHLRGIVSAALADPVVNACNLGEYVVFTDAAKFVDWIRSYMR